MATKEELLASYLHVSADAVKCTDGDCEYAVNRTGTTERYLVLNVAGIISPLYTLIHGYTPAIYGYTNKAHLLTYLRPQVIEEIVRFDIHEDVSSMVYEDAEDDMYANRLTELVDRAHLPVAMRIGTNADGERTLPVENDDVIDQAIDEACEYVYTKYETPRAYLEEKYEIRKDATELTDDELGTLIDILESYDIKLDDKYFDITGLLTELVDEEAYTDEYDVYKREIHDIGEGMHAYKLGEKLE